MSFGEIICWPFAKLLLLFYGWTGNYGVSVILFALVVNLILLPFMAKSKKSMMRTTRLQPRLKELERRHEGNQQKYQEEVMKLYREEKINPMSGCLWSLIPFPILIALYSVIRRPLNRMMGLSEEQVETIKNAISSLTDQTFTRNYEEIGYVQYMHEHWDAVKQQLGDGFNELVTSGLKEIDFSFLGMDLGSVPNFKFFTTVDWSNSEVWLPQLGLFLIPIIAAFMSWLSMKISQSTNPQPVTAGSAATSMKTMNIMMPLMSIWICFVMPGALGVYWIANSVFGIARDYSLTMVYRKQLDKEDAERIAREKEREEEMQRRREETERLRAEGATVRNNNTSKKRLQAQQKQEADSRRAEYEKAEREAKRAKKGIELDREDNPSQVGARRYARGRAYDPDRFGAVAAEPVEEAASDENAEAEIIQE